MVQKVNLTKDELGIIRKSVFLHANKLDRQVDMTGKALVGRNRITRDKLQVISLKLKKMM